ARPFEGPSPPILLAHRRLPTVVHPLPEPQGQFPEYPRVSGRLHVAKRSFCGHYQSEFAASPRQLLQRSALSHSTAGLPFLPDATRLRAPMLWAAESGPVAHEPSESPPAFVVPHIPAVKVLRSPGAPRGQWPAEFGSHPSFGAF